jgi:hypothetical protein
MSQRSLTGYDNRDAVSGKPDEEVYLYDAGTGGLACASCNPTGARPVGIEVRETSTLFASGRVWPKATLAGNVPGWTPYALGLARYQSRYLSDSGRLFFNSSDALVPGDVDGTEDVYEYEPKGVGGCTSTPAGGGVVFKPGGAFKVEGREGSEGAGCVGLISSGRSSEESGFLDASANGSDVFFLTAAKLSKEDFDTSLDIYDAHECTGSSPCFPAVVARPPACSSGDSCKAAPSVQPEIFGAPSSATFTGTGNVASPPPSPVKVKTAAQVKAEKLAGALAGCRKKRQKRVRVACEVSARKRYGAAKKPTVSRRRK